MRRRKSVDHPQLAFAVVLALFGTGTASGVTVIVNNSAEPIRGYLVSEDAVEIRIRQVSKSGSKVITIQRDQIRLMENPVDAERLSALTPDSPDEYHQYAEELVVLKADPEARELATRLFLVAAHLDRDRLGRSCVLGLTNFASTDLQRERCRALAYLLDPEHDRTLLGSGVVNTVVTSDKNSDTALLKLLEALQRGNSSGAKGIAKRNKPEALLAPYQQFLSLEELERALATRNGSLPSRVLHLRLLRLYHEVVATQVPAARHLTKTASRKWNFGLLSTDNQATVQPLSLETITRFDPRENVYRDGKWVRSPQ
jgi:hypothetical protein